MAQTPTNDRDIRFRDGLGLRVVTTDASGDAVEQLRLNSEIAIQETSIRERVGRLVNFRHVKYVRLRGVDRLKQGGKELVVSYDAIDGDRLSTILETAAKASLTLEVDVALQIVRDLLPGIGILHDSRKVTHGAIGPERLAYTAQHRLIILDHGLSLALGRLNQPRKKLWEQYRIAVPGSARGVFDERTDVVQIGIVALSALLARPLTDEEYPAQLKRLILGVKEHSRHGARPISPELRQWLERTLPVDEEHAYRTVREAQEAFEALVAKGRYAPSAAAVKSFLTRYREASASASPVETEQREAPAAADQRRTNVVERALEEFSITIGPRAPVSRSKTPVIEPAPQAPAPVVAEAPMPPVQPVPVVQPEPAAPAEAARTLVIASAIEGHPTPVRPDVAPVAAAPEATAPRAKTTRRSDRLSESPQARERVGDAARRARQSTLRSDIPRPAAIPDTSAGAEPRKTRGRLDALRALEEELSRLAALDLVMPRQSAPAAQAPVAPETPIAGANVPLAVLAEELEAAQAAQATPPAMAEAAPVVVAEAAAVIDTPTAEIATPVIAAVTESAPDRAERRAFMADSIDAELAKLMGERDPDECATPIWTIDGPESADLAALSQSALSQDAVAPLLPVVADQPVAVEPAAPLAALPADAVAALPANVVDALPEDAAAALEALAAFEAEAAQVSLAASVAPSVEAPLAVAAEPVAEAEHTAIEPAFELTAPAATPPIALSDSFELTAPEAESRVDERPMLLELSAFEQAADDIYATVAQTRQSAPLFEATAVVAVSAIEELATAESAALEAAAPEAAVAEVAIAEIAIAEVAIAEVASVEAAIEPGAIVEFAIAEPAVAESLIAELATAEPAAAEPAIAEIATVELPVDDVAFIAGVAEPAAEVASVEAVALTEVVAIVEPAVAEVVVAEVAVAETAIAETAIAETAVAETAIAETAVAEITIAEPAIAEVAVVETAIAETPIAETAVVEAIAMAETALVEIAATEPVAVVAEAAIAEIAIAETAIAETAIAETAVAETAIAEMAVAELAIAEPAIAEAAIAESTIVEPAVDEAPVAEAAPRRVTSFGDRVRGFLGGSFRKPRVEAAVAATEAAALPIDVAFESFDHVALEPVPAPAPDAPVFAEAPLVVEAPVVVAAPDAIEALATTEPVAIAPEPVAIAPEPVAVAPTPVAAPAAQTPAAAQTASNESRSKRKRSRKRNKKRHEAPAPVQQTVAPVAVTPPPVVEEPIEVSAAAAAVAPLSEAALTEAAEPRGETVDRVAFFEFDAGQVADAVPAWARGTSSASQSAEPQDDLQGIGAVQFQSGAADATPVYADHSSWEPRAVAPAPVAPPLPSHAQTLSLPAYAPAPSNVVPFQPAAEREMARDASEVAPAPVAAKRPRRSLISRINWGRTLAASLVLALLEGVAFAAAWWYVTPTELGWLVVHTRPAGIEISIDGMSRGQTPFAVSLRPGRHTIELRQGTATRVIPVEISAGVQTEQRVTWGKAFKTGQARITSTPDGAHVLVDGKSHGRTPVTISELSAGKHSVTVEASTGSVTSSLMIEAGETTELDVPVYSGWVSVLSPVELEIFESGRLIGTSEADKIMLAAGTHKLDVKNESLGYKGSQTIEVRPGATTAVSVLPTASVSVEGPAGAELFVDGDRVGVLPIAKLQTAIGTREFLFKHPDEGERRQVVVVTMTAPTAVKYESAGK